MWGYSLFLRKNRDRTYLFVDSLVEGANLVAELRLPIDDTARDRHARAGAQRGFGWGPRWAFWLRWLGSVDERGAGP